MAEFLDRVNQVVWGAPGLVMILGVGLYFSITLGFPQLRLFPRAARFFLTRLKRDPDNPEVSPFQALCTALAATVGTGNLVGVAGAIALGGPGSIFWMWISALLGMVTKFAEATLAVRFRTREGTETASGPMHIIRSALPGKWHFLGWIYSFFGVFAAFGVGNATQINAVISGVRRMGNSIGYELTENGTFVLALALAALIGAVLLGGAKRIGSASQLLVPFVSCGYIGLCLVALVRRAEYLPAAFASIFQGAFSPRAVTGGVVGSAFRTLRIGVSRGVFTNEAGMGTAAIAHGAAGVDHPCQQGLMGIMEVFLDTVVICTLTALVILSSGVNIPYGTDRGAELAFDAFTLIFGPGAAAFLSAALCCFAFATVLGWGLYGARCAQFLLGSGSWKYFALAQTGLVMVSAALETATVWSLAEIFNGLMAIPNLITLVLLRKPLQLLLIQYERKCGDHSAAGGTYENFYQCKPL